MACEDEEKRRSCRRYRRNGYSHRKMLFSGERESMERRSMHGDDGSDSGGLTYP